MADTELIKRIAAYHTANPQDYPVYHLFRDCASGGTIYQTNRLSGDDGRPLCTKCEDELDQVIRRATGIVVKVQQQWPTISW